MTAILRTTPKARRVHRDLHMNMASGASLGGDSTTRRNSKSLIVGRTDMLRVALQFHLGAEN
jgi:hypothetical protein